MAYKKYFYKNGKRFGPYFYESYRDKEGKVKKKYIGTRPKEERKAFDPTFNKVVLLVGIVILLVIGLSLTQDSSNPISKLSKTTYLYISSVIQTITGYATLDSPSISESQQENNISEEPIEQPPSPLDTPEEVPSEVISNINNTEVEQIQNQTLDNQTEGNILIQNETNQTNPIINITREQNQSINETIIAPINLEPIIDSNQSIMMGENNSIGNVNLINITVNQTVMNETLIENITVSNLSIIKEIGQIRIQKNENTSLNLNEYFSGAENYEIEEISNISFSIENNTLNIFPDDDFSGSRLGKITAFYGNESISSEFRILVSSGKIKVDVTRSNITLGEKVRWIQNVTLEIPENVTLEIPSEAENVSVKKIEDNNEQEINFGITGNVIANSNSNIFSSFFEFFKNLFSRFTGKVIDETIISEQNNASVSQENVTNPEQKNETIVEQQNETPKNSTNTIVLDENATNYVVEYYTPAPVSYEENKSYGKEVVISASSELNYTDVLSFTDINEKYKVGEENKIKIFWKENNSYVPFDAYDLDGNGKIDYVEWITPHLSNQTFQIVLITQAQLLDSNRSFIADVYEQVKTQDNLSVVVNDSQYLRVKFEVPLDDTRDITFYGSGNIFIENNSIPSDIYNKKKRIDEIRGQLDNG